MTRFRLLFPALLWVSFAASALAADYQSLLERGEFFLEKGNAYVPDSLRALEEAAEQSPAQAAGDPRFVSAIARAYSRAFRFTEAYIWLSGIERAGKSTPQTDAVRDHLLNEAGVGRVRLTSRFPLSGLTLEFLPSAETRLDVTGKKVLEKLNDWFSKPHSVGADGLTLLVPEGEYRVSSNHFLTNAKESSRLVESWAGDEKELAVVARHPAADQWTATALNRAVALSWPVAPSLRYRLERVVGQATPETRYEGSDAAFTDSGVPLGVKVLYRLYTLGPQGELLGVAEVEATAMPPVSEAGVEAQLESDLSTSVAWAVGEGTLDRVLVYRKSETGEKLLLDLAGKELRREGELRDGPIAPEPGTQVLTYRIEAWVEGEASPASATATVIVPAEVARIDEVSERIAENQVTVEWSTFPRDGVAEGFAVYLVKRPGGPGELVGRVANAFAREFDYVPKTQTPSAQWKHIVVPYVGKRFLVVPEPISFQDEIPSVEFEQRGKRRRQSLPELALSWKPYPDTRRYLVRVGDTEAIIFNDYIEIKGLQSQFQAENRLIEVMAIPQGGIAVPILTIDLRYDLYDTQSRGKP